MAAGLAVTLLFGTEVWPAFLGSAHFTRTVVLEQGNTGFAKMQSVFALVRLLGGGIALAYAAQAVSALMAVIVLWRIWRGGVAPQIKGAALCVAALLVTPYSMDYDLMALAPAIALLAAHGQARGFASWEILMLVLLWALPGAGAARRAISRSSAGGSGDAAHASSSVAPRGGESRICAGRRAETRLMVNNRRMFTIRPIA